MLILSEIEEMVIEDGSYDDSPDDDCGDYDDDDGFSLIRSNLQPFLIQSLLLTQGLPYRSNPHCTSAHCTLDKWTSAHWIPHTGQEHTAGSHGRTELVCTAVHPLVTLSQCTKVNLRPSKTIEATFLRRSSDF